MSDLEKSLPLARRTLPWDLEVLVYSCLPLDELPTVCQTSRGLRTHVIRFLRQLRHLRGFEVPATADAPVLALTLQHCRSLQTIDASFFELPFVESLPRPRLSCQWLSRLLQCNALSVRRVRLSDGNRHLFDAVSEALTRCPLLEEFGGNVSGQLFPDAAVARLTPQHLPHLRTLALAMAPPGAASDDNGGVTERQLCHILDQDWQQLRELQLVHASAEVLKGLQARQFQCLEKIVLKLDEQHAASLAGERVSWWNFLGQTLSRMARLRDLSIAAFVDSDSVAAMTESHTLLLPWSLPQLVRCRWRVWWNDGEPPDLQAKHLRALHLSTLNDKTVALCVSAPLLQTLHVVDLHTDDKCTWQTLAQHLAAGTWPQLTDVRVSVDHLDSLAPLCSLSAFCALTKLSCHVHAMGSDARQVLQLLQCHPTLHMATVLIRPYDRLCMSSVADKANFDKPADNDGGTRQRMCLPALKQLVLEIADTAMFAGLVLPSLTTLTLDSPRVQLSSLDDVLNACPALTQLSVLQVQVAQWIPTTRHDTLRHLDLAVPWSWAVKLSWCGSLELERPQVVRIMEPEAPTLVRMITAFPRLRRLRLPRWLRAVEQLVESAENGALSHLEALVIPDTLDRTASITVQQLQRLLMACPSLRSVDPGAFPAADRASINLWLRHQAAKGQLPLAVLCHCAERVWMD